MYQRVRYFTATDPQRWKSGILTDVRVALATLDVQSTLDKIHMEDRNHGPELSLTMAYTTRKTVNRLARNETATFKSCGVKPSKGGINLYIEQEKNKLDH